MRGFRTHSLNLGDGYSQYVPLKRCTGRQTVGSHGKFLSAPSSRSLCQIADIAIEILGKVSIQGGLHALASLPHTTPRIGPPSEPPFGLSDARKIGGAFRCCGPRF